MPHVHLKKNNYTVSLPHNQIYTVSAPLSMSRQRFVQLDSLKRILNYKVEI